MDVVAAELCGGSLLFVIIIKENENPKERKRNKNKKKKITDAIL